MILPVVNGMHDRFVRLFSENDYSIGGISSIATTLTAKQAAAIRLVYPTISPNRIRATASSGIAQNG